jgi:hypothetical protein
MKLIFSLSLFFFVLLTFNISEASNRNNTFLFQKDTSNPKSKCLEEAFRKFQLCIKNNDSAQLAKNLVYPLKELMKIGLLVENESDFKKYYSKFFNTYNKEFIQTIRFSDFSETGTATSKSFLMYKDVKLNPTKSDDCEDLIYVSIDADFKWFDFTIGNNVKNAKGNCIERIIYFTCVVDNSSCGFKLKKVTVF